MAKQNKDEGTWPRENRNTPPVENADSKSAVPESPVNTTPAEVTPPTEPEEPKELTAAQRFAAKTKATLKNLSEQENAAYEAEKTKEEAKEKPEAEDEPEFIDDTDYTKHNALGNSLKAKLAAAKAAATQSTPDA